MRQTILGICRFSFLGRGDWSAYKGTAHGSAAESDAMREVSDWLYNDRRMAFRFQAFEALTLPSLAAQTDPDFVFLVLSSAAMPEKWRVRLAEACARLPQLRLIFSEMPDVNSALAPVLRDYQDPGQQLVQFRLDDDDCIFSGYVSALRKAARAMTEYSSFAFSLPRGLLVTHYPDQGVQHYELTYPFHAAGVGARMRSAGQSIFVFGHYALARKFPALTDYHCIGSLQLKVQGHDSRRLEAVRGSGLRPIEKAVFLRALETGFAFLDPAVLAELVAHNDDLIA